MILTVQLANEVYDIAYYDDGKATSCASAHAHFPEIPANF